MKPPTDPMSGDTWLQREAVLDRFESAWQAGAARIEDFLPEPGDPARGPLLRELVKIDMEYHGAKGEPALLAGYLERFPELAEAGAPPRELLDEETRVRRQHAREPRRIGRYAVREELGRGTFGAVYRCWDADLRREVAVKVPHPGLLDDPALRARLLREASSAARLRHPAIVPIHEVGEDGAGLFIVYDCIRGPTLAALLRQTRPAPRQAAEWLAHLAEALDYAHTQGIIHRDIKPANVLMDQGSRPVLADFGLALQADASARLTEQGQILGTPAYMAQEQATGLTADGRSDVYSLGVMLYEMLCGRLPFEGGVAQILHGLLHEEPAPPSRHRPGIPIDLETICVKAMAKEPSRRYATAGVLADDLRRFLAGEPVLARKIRVWQRAI